VLAACFTFLTIKVEHAVSDIAFNLFMRGFAYGMGPEENYLPRYVTFLGAGVMNIPTFHSFHPCTATLQLKVLCRSFDLMRAVLQVKAAEDYELHMCPTASCGSTRKRPPVEQWSLDHRCRHCNAKLYKVEAGHVRPVKR
jgi:hypothetical protein